MDGNGGNSALPTSVDQPSQSVQNSPTPITVQPPVQTTQPQANIPQQTAVQPQTISVEPEKPKKKSRLKKILLIIGGLVIIAVILLGFLLFKGVKDAPEVQSKVTSFMQNVSSGNYQSAYDLTSKEFKESTSMDEFTRAMSLFKAQYTEFQSQEQVGFHVEANAGQPTLYEYSAIVNYTDGDNGELIAILVKEDDDYKILSIEERRKKVAQLLAPYILESYKESQAKPNQKDKCENKKIV